MSEKITLSQIIETAQNALSTIPQKLQNWPKNVFVFPKILITKRREFLGDKQQFKQAIELFKQITSVMEKNIETGKVSKLKKLLQSDQFKQLYDLDELENRIGKAKGQQDEQINNYQQQPAPEININLSEVDLESEQLLIPNKSNNKYDLTFIYQIFGIKQVQQAVQEKEEILIFSPLQTIQQNPIDMEDLKNILLKSYDQEARCQLTLKFMISKAQTSTDINYEYLLALLMREFEENPDLKQKNLQKHNSSLEDELDEVISMYISKFYTGVLSLPFIVYSITKQNTQLIQSQLQQLSLLGFLEDEFDSLAELPRCTLKQETIDGQVIDTLQQKEETEFMKIFSEDVQTRIDNFINMSLDEMANELFKLETTEQLHSKLYHLICIIKSKQQNIKDLFDNIKKDFDQLTEQAKNDVKLEKKQKQIEQLITTSRILYGLTILESDDNLEKSGKTLYTLLKKYDFDLSNQLCEEYFTKFGDIYFICNFITFLYFILLSIYDEGVDDSIKMYDKLTQEAQLQPALLEIIGDVINHNYNEDTDLLLRQYCNDKNVLRQPLYVQSELDKALLGTVVPENWLENEF